MLDHNFKYKRMVEIVEPINLNYGVDNDIRQLVSSIVKANKTYQVYV